MKNSQSRALARSPFSTAAVVLRIVGDGTFTDSTSSQPRRTAIERLPPALPWRQAVPIRTSVRAMLHRLALRSQRSCFKKESSARAGRSISYGAWCGMAPPLPTAQIGFSSVAHTPRRLLLGPLSCKSQVAPFHLTTCSLQAPCTTGNETLASKATATVIPSRAGCDFDGGSGIHDEAAPVVQAAQPPPRGQSFARAQIAAQLARFAGQKAKRSRPRYSHF